MFLRSIKCKKENENVDEKGVPQFPTLACVDSHIHARAQVHAHPNTHGPL